MTAECCSALPTHKGRAVFFSVTCLAGLEPQICPHFRFYDWGCVFNKTHFLNPKRSIILINITELFRKVNAYLLTQSPLQNLLVSEHITPTSEACLWKKNSSQRRSVSLRLPAGNRWHSQTEQVRDVNKKVSYKGVERSRDLYKGCWRTLGLKEQKVMVIGKLLLTPRSEGTCARSRSQGG